MENLLAKARGLEEEGISTWIYSGAYPADSGHITGTLRSDIVLIDKILGGKVAMSDHRSSMPSTQAYASLAAEARIGGMLSGKAGVLHIHMGDGKRGLEPVLRSLNNRAADQCVPSYPCQPKSHALQTDYPIRTAGRYY